MAIFHSILLSFSVIFTVCATTDTNIATSAAPSAFPSSHTHVHVTKLVDQICNGTSNYTFCVSALYSDPRTPDADGYTLAYIAFGLAYLNASKTPEHITLLLKKSSSPVRDHQNLQRCQLAYKTAVQNLESAFNDLNSETFFTLPRYANDTARVAEDCERHYPPLKSTSLKFLCEICFVISKLFTVSS